MEAEGDTLEPQGGSTDGDYLRAVPEQGHQLGSKDDPQRAYGEEERGRAFDAEPESFFHTVIELSTVVKAAYRLEALAEANHGGGTEHHDALHHAHGGDGGVAVGLGCQIQADGGRGGQTLPGQGGQAAPDDLGVIGPF